MPFLSKNRKHTLTHTYATVWHGKKDNYTFLFLKSPLLCVRVKTRLFYFCLLGCKSSDQMNVSSLETVRICSTDLSQLNMRQASLATGQRPNMYYWYLATRTRVCHYAGFGGSGRRLNKSIISEVEYICYVILREWTVRNTFTFKPACGKMFDLMLRV